MKRPFHTNTSHRFEAFTLIELLVVVAIIALLMALLFPALSNLRQVTRALACASNMRIIGHPMLTFARDHGGRMPGGGSLRDTNTGWSASENERAND